MWASPGAAASANWTARGTMIAMVPHEVPVANATRAAHRKVAAGMSGAMSTLPSDSVTKWAVSISLQTALRAHARMRTTMAMSMDFIPASHAASVSPSERIPWTRARPPAIRHPAAEAHIRTLKESPA